MMRNSYIIGMLLLMSCLQNNVNKEVVLSAKPIGHDKEIKKNEGAEEQEKTLQISTDELTKGALAYAKGDLDKDSIKELAVVNNVNKSNDDGTKRELIIYKNKNGVWMEWYKSSTAIMGDADGGVMGDPFEDIAINNNVLSISHWGGSSWMWGYDHKFRYQNNEMELIGVTSTFGKRCEEEEEFDFNVSTGHINYTNKVFTCDDEGNEKEEKEEKIKFTYTLDPKPVLKNFEPGMSTIFLVNGDIEKQFDY